MVNTDLRIVYGAGGGIFREGVSKENGNTLNDVEEFVKALEAEGIKHVDTAEAYGASETALGQTNAASRFTIDTKLLNRYAPGDSNKETVIIAGEASLKKLHTDSVDIYYLHQPDRQNPLEGVLAGINALYVTGKFKRFGLSNFLAGEVEDVIRTAKKNNWVLPSVYQGNYSAVARVTEKEIMPTLRKHNIAFYAYSPIAGGFLTKDPQELVKGGAGRWDPESYLGKMYRTLYEKPAFLKALETWGEIAAGLGISKGELGYRWVAYNSRIDGRLGDAIIVGGRTVEQFKQSMEWLRKGPLTEDVAEKIDEFWTTIENEAALDNMNNSVFKK